MNTSSILGVQQILSSIFVFSFMTIFFNLHQVLLVKNYTNLRLIVNNNVFFYSSPIGTKVISQCLEGIQAENAFLLCQSTKTTFWMLMCTPKCVIYVFDSIRKWFSDFTIKDKKEHKKVKKKLEKTLNFLLQQDNSQGEPFFHLPSFQKFCFLPFHPKLLKIL
jgi:hypothetical protein